MDLQYVQRDLPRQSGGTRALRILVTEAYRWAFEEGMDMLRPILS